MHELEDVGHQEKYRPKQLFVTIINNLEFVIVSCHNRFGCVMMDIC